MTDDTSSQAKANVERFAQLGLKVTEAEATKLALWVKVEAGNKPGFEDVKAKLASMRHSARRERNRMKRAKVSMLINSGHPGLTAQSAVTTGTDIEAARKEVEYENWISNPQWHSAGHP